MEETPQRHNRRGGATLYWKEGVKQRAQLPLVAPAEHTKPRLLSRWPLPHHGGQKKKNMHACTVTLLHCRRDDCSSSSSSCFCWAPSRTRGNIHCSCTGRDMREGEGGGEREREMSKKERKKESTDKEAVLVLWRAAEVVLLCVQGDA